MGVAGGGRLRHVALRRSGWEENVGQQKLAVVWMRLRRYGRWSRRSEPSLVEVAVAVVEELERKGRVARERELCLGEGGGVMDNCARAGRMQVQCSSRGWERSLMAMLIVLWRRSCCFRPF